MDLIPFDPRQSALTSREDHQRFLDEWLAGKKPATIKAYREDVLRAAGWLGLSSGEEFIQLLLSRGPGEANRLAIAFKAWAAGKNWSPSYVNNHLAAFRSIVKFARTTGRIVWALDVRDEKAEKFRDTKGPGIAGVVGTLEQAKSAQPPARASRDVAIVSLLAMRGLRRDEIVSLDLEHVDLLGERLLVQRKKRTQRTWVTIPPFCVNALRAWLSFRGDDDGPLFLSFCIATNSEKRGLRRQDGRLAESSVWWLVRNYALAAGVPKSQARPHGFRHAAITEVLELSGGNIRAGQLFADHSNPVTTTIYDDNRKDVAGEMSRKLAERIESLLKRDT